MRSTSPRRSAGVLAESNAHATRTPVVGHEGLELQGGYRLEDPVVGDQADAERQSGEVDSTVGVVLALMQRMPQSLAVSSEPGVDHHEFGAGVHRLSHTDLGLQPEFPGWPHPRRRAPN
jgi:hypothetical protein